MRKHAKHYHAHVNSFLRAQKSFLCACKSQYLFIIIFYLRDSVCCHFEKINEKIIIYIIENKNIYRWLNCKYNQI